MLLTVWVYAENFTLYVQIEGTKAHIQKIVSIIYKTEFQFLCNIALNINMLITLPIHFR